MSDDVFGILGTTQAQHFKIEEAVAEGGFAVVYRAQHQVFRAPVALKCLKVPGTISLSQRTSFLNSFREEAELLFRLSSILPAVVRPLQVGTLEIPSRFVPFIALEWLEGESLHTIRTKRNKRKEPPLDLAKLAKMLVPIAQAISQAHRIDSPTGPVAIIHCDLKPENLFLSKIGGIELLKILDFGIARVKNATNAIAGKATVGVGGMHAFTPQYGAPEQWLPETFGQTGPWTDVWGLAITMVDMMLGGEPISGSLGTMLQAATHAERRPTPRSFGLNVPDGAEIAFRAALEVDPKRRTQDIRTFWTAIERSLDMRLSFEGVDETSSEPARILGEIDAGQESAPRRGATTGSGTQIAPANSTPSGGPLISGSISAPVILPMIPDLGGDDNHPTTFAAPRTPGSFAPSTPPQPPPIHTVQSAPSFTPPGAPHFTPQPAFTPLPVFTPQQGLTPPGFTSQPGPGQLAQQLAAQRHVPSSQPGSTQMGLGAHGAGAQGSGGQGVGAGNHLEMSEFDKISLDVDMPGRNGPPQQSRQSLSSGHSPSSSHPAMVGSAARPAMSSAPHPAMAGHSGPRAMSSRAPTAPGMAQAFRHDDSSTNLWSKLKTPSILVAVGMAIMIGDYIYFHVVGTRLELGPARPVWVAGPLVGLGLVLGMVNFLRSA